MKYVELRRVNTDESFVDLPDFVSVTFDSIWNPSPSVINLTYPLAKATAAGIQAGAFIAVLPDGNEIPDRFVLEQRQGITVTDSGLAVTWSGRSMKAILEDDFVWPSAWPNPVPAGHAFVDANAGTIMKTFLTRSQERGFMTMLTHTSFTGFVDSTGASWASLIDKNFSNGTSLLAVAQNLFEMGMIELRTNKFAVEMYKPGNLSRHLLIDNVCFTAGKNIGDESTQQDSSNFYTDVLMEGEQVAKTATDASSYTKIGRRRARYSQAGGIADEGVVQLLANTDLQQYNHVQTERSLAVTHQSGEPQPFTDYRVGDWVWLDIDGTPVEIQVQQIAVQVQNGQIPSVSITLGDVLDSIEESLKRRIDAITGSNAGSYGPIPGTTGLLDLAPAAPTGVGWTTGIYVDDKGVNRVAATITWNEVTTNADGTTAYDISSYEVFMRDDSSSANWQLIGKASAGTPVAFYSPLPEATYKRFKVEALDQAGHRSAPSAEFRAQTPIDVTGPPQPSAPTGATKGNTVSVTWDGLSAVGGSMGLDFAFLEVHKSTTSGFAPGPLTLHTRIRGGAGTVDITGLTGGSTWFFKFRALDVSGNVSIPSAQYSATIAYIQKTDLDVAVRNDIDTALTTASTANSTAGTANTKADNLLTNLNTNYYTKPQVDTAISTAATGNKVIYSTSPASGSTRPDGSTPVFGDIWRQVDTTGAGGKILAEWTWTSGSPNAWVTRVYSGAILTALDAGTITSGFLSSNRIQAGSLTIGKVNNLQTTLDRGADLITNGTGLAQNNTNFSLFDFNGADAPNGSNGSFVIKTTVNQSATIDETLAFDPAKRYRFSFQCRQTVSGQSAKLMYGYIAPYDLSGNTITPAYYMYVANTTTTLAAPLNPGDTTITLTSSANWYGSASKPAGTSTFLRGVIIWDYTDAAGKTWAPGTYSRNAWYSLWADGGISGNVITLSAPWPAANGSHAAGTSISNSTSGGSFVYMPSATGTAVPETWTQYGDDFSAGIMAPSAQAVPATGAATWTTGLPPGTAKIRVGWLLNYTTGGGKHAIASVSFSEGGAANNLASKVDALTQGWVNPYPGMVSINGGSILADSIGTTALKASIIGAKQLLVADTANMAEIQENTAGVVTYGAPTPWTHVLETVSGNIWSKRDLPSANQFFMFRNQAGPLPIKQGDRVRLTFEAFADATVTATASIWTYGSTTISWNLAVAPTPLEGSAYPTQITTTPQTFAFEADVPALTNAPTSYLIGLSGLTGANVRVRNVRAYRMGAGELVVDGTIEGKKIKANSITAQQMAVGSVTAQAIAARAIGADKLIVGGVMNVVPNGAGEWGTLGGIFPVGTPGISYDAVDKPAELQGVFKAAAGTGTTATDTGTYMQWDCEPNQEFYYEVWGKADVANSKMYIEVRDQAGTRNVTTVATNDPSDIFGGGSGYLLNGVTLTTGWIKYSGILKAAAGTTKMRIGFIYFNHTSGTVTTASQSVAIRIRTRNSGRLIVDGTVTANQLSGTAIDGKTITGAVIRTADPALNSPRWELGRNSYENTLLAYTGSSNEVAPAKITSSTTAGGIQLMGSDFGKGDAPAVLTIGSQGTYTTDPLKTDWRTYATLSAEDCSLYSYDAGSANPLDPNVIDWTPSTSVGSENAEVVIYGNGMSPMETRTGKTGIRMDAQMRSSDGLPMGIDVCTDAFFRVGGTTGATQKLVIDSAGTTITGNFIANLTGGNSVTPTLNTGFGIRSGYAFTIARLGTGAVLINGNITLSAAMSSGATLITAANLPTWARPAATRTLNVAGSMTASASTVPSAEVSTSAGIRIFGASGASGAFISINGVYPL